MTVGVMGNHVATHLQPLLIITFARHPCMLPILRTQLFRHVSPNTREDTCMVMLIPVASNTTPSASRETGISEESLFIGNFLDLSAEYRARIVAQPQQRISRDAACCSLQG